VIYWNPRLKILKNVKLPMNSNFFKAIALAPWTVFPIVFTSALVFGKPDSLSIGDTFPWAFVYAICAVLVAYIGVLFFGIPSFWLLKRIGWLGFWQLLSLGVFGPLVFVGFNAPLRERVLAGICGGVVVCCAWYLYKSQVTRNL
jgi:hypothetical protein